MLSVLEQARHVHVPNAAPSHVVQAPELATHGPPQQLPPAPAAIETTAQNCLERQLLNSSLSLISPTRNPKA
jgi:hypothetical protein